MADAPSFRDQIPDIERRVRDSGHTVKDLCVKADISQSTWTRWKQKDGFEPRRSNEWAVLQAVQKFEADAERAAVQSEAAA